MEVGAVIEFFRNFYGFVFEVGKPGQFFCINSEVHFKCKFANILNNSIKILAKLTLKCGLDPVPGSAWNDAGSTCKGTYVPTSC